jgi:hypothetical protein
LACSSKLSTTGCAALPMAEGHTGVRLSLCLARKGGPCNALCNVLQGLGGRAARGGGVDCGTHPHQRRPGCVFCVPFDTSLTSLTHDGRPATGAQPEHVLVQRITGPVARPLELGRLLQQTHRSCCDGASHAAGKEVVVRYGSSLKTGRRFATDANGREMQVRWRPQHTLDSPSAPTVR